MNRGVNAVNLSSRWQVSVWDSERLRGGGGQGIRESHGEQGGGRRHGEEGKAGRRVCCVTSGQVEVCVKHSERFSPKQSSTPPLCAAAF